MERVEELYIRPEAQVLGYGKLPRFSSVAYMLLRNTSYQSELGSGRLRSFALATLGVACSLFAAPIFAIPVQVTVQGILAKDGAPTLFGITDAVVPFQFSFIVESNAVTTVAAGTILNGNGASYSSNAQLVPSSAITDFVANIGNVSFTQSDITTEQIDDSGLFYNVFLLGDLVDQGISAAALTMTNDFSFVRSGSTFCFLTCIVTPDGSAVDLMMGSTGEISGLQVHAQELTPAAPVPEPATLALFGLGLAGLSMSRRRRCYVGHASICLSDEHPGTRTDF